MLRGHAHHPAGLEVLEREGLLDEPGLPRLRRSRELHDLRFRLEQDGHVPRLAFRGCLKRQRIRSGVDRLHRAGDRRLVGGGHAAR